MGVRCFYIEPIGRTRLSLRVYENGSCPSTPTAGYHNAHTPLYDVVERKVPDEPGHDRVRDWHYEHDGPQRPEDVFMAHEWPSRCACGYAFTVQRQRQVFSDHLYRRVDTGEVRTLRDWDRVPGAMWDAEWLSDNQWYRGPDGRSLHVVCPNGRTWAIDGPANNCTNPKDHVHKCWVRHGTPPVITVDKAGLTCAAGAGSIQAGDYHGFLRNGEFT